MTEQTLAIGTATWRRAIWMRIAALTGLTSVLIWFAANTAGLDVDTAAKLRLGAQVQFMHGMVVFSCATFMNIGARDARHAPPFLFAGMLFYSVPLYIAAWLGTPPQVLIQDIGITAFGIGWLILAWSAREIDVDATG